MYNPLINLAFLLAIVPLAFSYALPGKSATFEPPNLPSVENDYLSLHRHLLN